MYVSYIYISDKCTHTIVQHVLSDALGEEVQVIAVTHLVTGLVSCPEFAVYNKVTEHCLDNRKAYGKFLYYI